MGNLFGQDSFLTNFLTRIADLMVLNFLWVIGCVPIITIGTSTVALYYCVEQYRVNGGIKVMKTFWDAYRSNFKQATALMGIFLLAVGVLLADTIILYVTELELHTLVLILMGIVSLLCLLALGFVFPLQARFANTVKQTVKNAWLMSILHLPKSFLVAVLNLLPLIVWLLWPNVFYRCFGVWLLVGVSGTAYINNIILQGIFQQYYDKEMELDRRPK